MKAAMFIENPRIFLAPATMNIEEPLRVMLIPAAEGLAWGRTPEWMASQTPKSGVNS